MSSAIGESFTIQISNNLARLLVDDGEKVKKNTRKPKPKFNRNPQQVQDNSSNLPKGLPSTGWPNQPPLYLLTTPPPKKFDTAEFDAILASLEASERVVERLQKQEENMVNEVSQRAKELHDKEFKLPNCKPIPCLEEIASCLKCYMENIKDTLKCGQLVEGFAECARRVRQEVREKN